MEYYSAIKKKILPFVTTWIELGGIMLSEISQINTNTSQYKDKWSYLYVDLKKPNS